MSKQKQVVLKQAHGQLNKFLEKKQAALPSDFNETRFLQNCMTVLQDTKNIEKMKPVSIARTMLKGAFLGLDFFNGECYAIPYGNDLNFQTDWTGERKLALKYSQEPISDIYAKAVYENDRFSSGVKNGKQYLHHEEAGFDQGEIIGAYAVADYTSGNIKYEKMSKADIESIRDNFSKAPKSIAWKHTFGEMCKKVVIRRLCKGIELNFDNQEQKSAHNEGGGMEFDNELENNKEQSPFDAVDVDYEDVEEEPEDDFAKDVEETLKESEK